MYCNGSGSKLDFAGGMLTLSHILCFSIFQKCKNKEYVKGGINMPPTKSNLLPVVATCAHPSSPCGEKEPDSSSQSFHPWLVSHCCERSGPVLSSSSYYKKWGAERILKGVSYHLPLYSQLRAIFG